MQKHNALDLIQQVKDYFLSEYGLVVKVSVTAFDENNVSPNVAKEILTLVGQEIDFNYKHTTKLDGNNLCGSVENWDNKTSFSLYYSDIDPQTR